VREQELSNVDVVGHVADLERPLFLTLFVARLILIGGEDTTEVGESRMVRWSGAVLYLQASDIILERNAGRTPDRNTSIDRTERKKSSP
jgi:hypothetical protein